MRKKAIFIAMLSTLAVSFACNSGNKPTAPAKSEGQTEVKTAVPQYETGRSAFQKLFVAARAFAPDVKPFRLESSYTPGAPAMEGKAALWRGQFASASKRSIKAYSWSGLTGPGAEPGVSHGTEDSYNPSNSSTQVFDVAFLKIDSDKALEVAQKHGGEKLTKKDPKQPIFYVLDFDPKASELVWHVIYGESRSDAKLRIAVNATSGAFLHIEH